MRIAVIIVVMNDRQGLTLTLNSLLDSHDLIQTVVVKDGSKEKLMGDDEIKSEYGKLNLLYLHTPDSGIYDAMNQAILIAPKCDYLWFLNAGDTLSSKKALTDAVNAIKEYHELPDLCLFGWKVGGKIVHPWWLSTIILENNSFSKKNYLTSVKVSIR